MCASNSSGTNGSLTTSSKPASRAATRVASSSFRTSPMIGSLPKASSESWAIRRAASQSRCVTTRFGRHSLVARRPLTAVRSTLASYCGGRTVCAMSRPISTSAATTKTRTGPDAVCVTGRSHHARRCLHCQREFRHAVGSGFPRPARPKSLCCGRSARDAVAVERCGDTSN